MFLDSMESYQSLGCVHASEGAMGDHHVDEKITCFMQLHDDFYDFFHLSHFPTSPPND